MTGGTGFVGSHLAHRLASIGVEVVVIAPDRERGLLRAGSASLGIA
ncbi:MAG: NAD-dependent epimerase/dehydratase family protein [Thermoanaerobaculia bacterium]